MVYQTSLHRLLEELDAKTFCDKVKKETAYVYQNISYLADVRRGYYEYWQLPLETLQLGTGDCEDMAILLMCLLEKHNIKSSLSIGTLIDSRGQTGHAWVTFDYKDERWNIEATGGFIFAESPPNTPLPTETRAIYVRKMTMTLPEVILNIEIGRKRERQRKALEVINEFLYEYDSDFLGI